MLIAAKRKNLRTKLFYEDEITSLAFDALTYMSASEIWSFFSRILPKKVFREHLLLAPYWAKVYFWPDLVQLFQCNGNRSKVEPDFMIRFYFKERSTTLDIIFELKWDYHLCPKEELLTQWASIPKGHRQNCLHIYLVKKRDISHENEIEFSIGKMRTKSQRALWQDRLICCDWSDICKVAAELVRDRSPELNNVRHWSENIISFFRKALHLPDDFRGFKRIYFSSFENIDVSLSDLPDGVRPPLFFEESLMFNFYSPTVCAPVGPIFFKEINKRKA